MKALFLEDVRKFAVRELPEPECGDREVLVEIAAVGICGTDFHIWSGAGNYNTDRNGRAIPLALQPQILGHEFVGTVVQTGRAVEDLPPGTRLVFDQGLNCFSQGHRPPCDYCRSGDSHQCRHYQERGITGYPGAMQERIGMPAVNAVPLPSELSFEEAVLAEPLGCVIHAMEKARQASSRFALPGSDSSGPPVGNILIQGAGPAGLLFLQYLKRVLEFEGPILVSDRVPEKLRLVEQFGGLPLDLREGDLAGLTREHTGGKKIHFVVEACGHGEALAEIPTVLEKQGTVLLYGHGHEGTDLSVLGRLLFLEPTLVAPVGASGELDGRTHRPRIYERAVELLHSGQIQVRPLITHRYANLEEVEKAFQQEHLQPDYIKGLLLLQAPQRPDR